MGRGRSGCSGRSGRNDMRRFLMSYQLVINVVGNWNWVLSQCLDVDRILLCNAPGVGNFVLVNGDIDTAQDQGYLIMALDRNSIPFDIRAATNMANDAYDRGEAFVIMHDPEDDEAQILGPLVVD